MTTLESKILTNIRLIKENYPDEGKSWYDRERVFIRTVAKMFKMDDTKCFGIYSAFSPLKSVELNRKLLFQFLLSGGKKAGHMTSCVNKAIEIYNLNRYGIKLTNQIREILKGDKTCEFFDALYGSYSACPIDRHMFKLLPEGFKQTEKNAQVIKKVIQQEKPYQTFELQAFLWEVLKEEKSMSNIKNKHCLHN